jgi:hypothetical protein
MASDETVRSALREYLTRHADPKYEVQTSSQFDTGNVIGRVRAGSEVWFVAITEERYDEWPETQKEIVDWLETNRVYEELPGHGIGDALFITTQGLQTRPLSPRRFDIVGYDERGLPSYIVELKATRSVETRERFIKQVTQYLKRLRSRPAFFMIVDPEFIDVLTPDNDKWHTEFKIPTQAIVKAYDKDYRSERIHEHYLSALVEGWLRDLSYNWRSEDPPGKDSFTKSGLLGFLRHGTTRSEVTL